MKHLIRRASCCIALACVCALPAQTQDAGGRQEPERAGAGIPNPARPVPDTLDVAAARKSLDEALNWLATTQNDDGSWGGSSLDGLLELGFSVETYYAWQLAAHGLAVLALAEADSTPAVDAALTKSIEWLTTTRMPKRGSNWDVDYVWSALYAYSALAQLALDERFATVEGAEPSELAAAIDQRGRAYWEILERNEVPNGGWAYYDDPPYTRRPKWATSFCSALVLPALKRGMELGWIEDPGHLERARKAVLHCALPNGAYTYTASRPIPRPGAGESINNVKGSLGRIQVCNWGLATIGEETITTDRVREGLEAFFEHHKFLDVARMRPIPHEAYYANAGYFYLFAHVYAAFAIELLPPSEQEQWHARLRPHLVKIQNSDGTLCDFIGSSYTVTAGTAMGALALQLGLPPIE